MEELEVNTVELIKSTLSDGFKDNWYFSSHFNHPKYISSMEYLSSYEQMTSG